MDRRQPAMQIGDDGRRHWSDAAGFDHTAPRVLTRGWAVTRLVMLVVACGVGAAIVVAISIAILAALAGDI